MKYFSKTLVLIATLALVFILPQAGIAQLTPTPITIGLLQNDPGTFDGYVLMASVAYPTAYLINTDGQVVHSWVSVDVPRHGTYLREDGLLLRTRIGGTEFGMNGAGAGGGVQLLDWDGTVLWDYVYADTTYRHHHDIKPMPNGNVLIMAWEKKSAVEAYAAGRDSAFVGIEVWSERIAEIRPIFPDSAEIVWIWHAWDHLIQDYDSTKANFGVVEDHPELIDINYAPRGILSDWLHFNAIAYNEELDQIIYSANFWSEVAVIDHSTTTAEAAGHTGGQSGKGGDLLYRWGNPEAYRAGDSTDRVLYSSHDVHWITDSIPGQGRLILHNNGNNRLGDTINYSSTEEFTPPVDTSGDYILLPDSAYGPKVVDWHYQDTPKENFYSRIMSGADRLPNGNTIICAATTGHIFEVDSLGNKLWQYINPANSFGPMAQGSIPGPNAVLVFKVRKYATDYIGLVGKDLTPQGPIETYCCSGRRGDLNGDSTSANIIDLTFIVDYIFRGSSDPGFCFEASDVNADGQLGAPNILDLTYLIDFIFRGGPQPIGCQQTP